MHDYNRLQNFNFKTNWQKQILKRAGFHQTIDSIPNDTAL